MRKIVFALIALVLAAPAFGSVVITATDEGGGNVAISYNATTEPNNVRAFALNITVTAGVIDDVCDYNVGESNSTALGYGIFMGTINIDPVTGEVISYGSPVAPNDAPGALGGIGTSGVTIEMGSLYEDGNAPPDSGTLCKIHVSENCNLNVTAEDVHRGGVVMEDGSGVAPDLTGATDVAIGECFPSNHPDYDEWVLMDRPASWCYTRQCHGDADNAQEKIGLKNYWVGFNDLGVLIANWQDKLGVTSALPADFDHASEKIGLKNYRVGFNDLGVLIANWQDKLGSPPDCLDVL